MKMATQSNIVVKSGYQSKSKEVSDFTYENKEIPQSLIDECEKRFIDSGEIHFIFDNTVSNIIKNRYDSKAEKREILIDDLLDDSYTTSLNFHIGSELYFREMPSRFSYYDTETKETCRYKKYKILTNFLDTLGFSPLSEFNFGPEYDQSYTLLTSGKNIIIRVKPNLFLSIQSGFTDDYHQRIIFDGFFSRSKIMESLKNELPNFTEVIRDIKLNTIL